MRAPLLALALVALLPGCAQDRAADAFVAEHLPHVSSVDVHGEGARRTLEPTDAAFRPVAEEALRIVAGITSVHRSAFSEGDPERIANATRSVALRLDAPITRLPRYEHDASFDRALVMAGDGRPHLDGDVLLCGAFCGEFSGGTSRDALGRLVEDALLAPGAAAAS